MSMVLRFEHKRHSNPMPGGWPDDERSVFTDEGRTERQDEAHDFGTRLTTGRDVIGGRTYTLKGTLTVPTKTPLVLEVR